MQLEGGLHTMKSGICRSHIKPTNPLDALAKKYEIHKFIKIPGSTLPVTRESQTNE